CGSPARGGAPAVAAGSGAPPPARIAALNTMGIGHAARLRIASPPSHAGWTYDISLDYTYSQDTSRATPDDVRAPVAIQASKRASSAGRLAKTKLPLPMSSRTVIA